MCSESCLISLREKIVEAVLEMKAAMTTRCNFGRRNTESGSRLVAILQPSLIPHEVRDYRVATPI